MNINYNEISKIYDDVREEERSIIQSFFNEVKLNENSVILDIGCGTGNYTNIIQRLTEARVYGLDQSEGMLEKAKAKNRKITFFQGNALHTPFENNSFDFIYMTDVIHHIQNIEQLFIELNRILKDHGKICISTQSHRQIDLRAMTSYFPETSVVDKLRYPDLELIREKAESNYLKFLKINIIGEGEEIKLDQNFLHLLEKKGYSMLHLITDENYQNGLRKVKMELEQGEIISKSAGTTLVWFTK